MSSTQRLLGIGIIISAVLTLISFMYVTKANRTQKSNSVSVQEVSEIPAGEPVLLQYKRKISESISSYQLDVWEVIPDINLLLSNEISEFYFNLDNNTGYKIRRSNASRNENCTLDSCEWSGYIVRNNCSTTENSESPCESIHMIIANGEIVLANIPGNYQRYNKSFVYELKKIDEYENTLLIAKDLSNMGKD